MQRLLSAFVFSCLSCGAVAAQGQLIVPASSASTDANSIRWVAGFSDGLRQQNVIDPSHLSSMIGRQVTALSFRRDAGYAKALAGGQADLVVKLGHAPVPASRPSSNMDVNLGSSPTECFRGIVALPSSPPLSNGVATWGPADTVTIRFTTPFAYTGGTLCVEILGRPVVGAWSPIWPADAALDTVQGRVQTIGPGCQAILATRNGETSRVSPRGLVPGSTATFIARGTPAAPALSVIGLERSQPLNLGMLGLPACNLFLDPIATVATVFAQPMPPIPPLVGGQATVALDVPASAALFSASFVAQWVDSGPPIALTNAVRCTVSSSVPSLGLGMVTALWDGASIPTGGSVALGVGHVIRFEYR